MTTFLVGWDGSPASDAALEWAAARAKKADTVHVLTVVPQALQDKTFLSLILPGIDVSEVVQPKSFQENTIARIRGRCDDLKCAGEVRPEAQTGEPAHAMLDAVRGLDVDHLVVGFKSYERDLPNGIGHVAERLVRMAPCTVTVVRPPPEELATRKGDDDTAAVTQPEGL